MGDTRLVISGQAYFLLSSSESFKGNECPGIYINLPYVIILFYFFDELENLLTLKGIIESRI